MPLNPPLKNWQGKVVWLIGASTGIGRATASALHAHGATVVVSARSAEGLDRFVAAHPGSRALPLDATDAQSVKSAAETILRQSDLDCVFYCAGYYRETRSDDMDLADMVRHVQINYVGALNLLDAVLPYFLRRAQAGHPGHISLMGSVAGFRGLPKSLAYGPTKAALINLAETLYLDLHELGIGVSVINPGFVDTPLTAQNGFDMPALISPGEAAEAILHGWARGRFEMHFPKRFTFWMKALQLLPYRLYFAITRRITQT